MSGRFVYWIAAIFSLTAVYTCWCGTPLIYDGAYQFAFTLIWQKPYVYLTRFHTLLLWQPTVWLSHYTSNLHALTFAYGLPFVLAPVVGLLVSWWFVRKEAPWLIVWAIFGIAAAPLPGQIFIINDSIFQQHLFWPIFLGLLVPLNRPQKVAFAVLVVFQFVHQIGLVLLGGAAGCALVLALLSREDREYRRRMFRSAAVAAGLALLMGVKVGLTSSPSIPYFGKWYDSYAAAEASWSVARQRWIAGVKGAPIRGLCLMYAGGILVLLRGLLRSDRPAGSRRIGNILSLLAIACIFSAGVIWVMWASNDSRWAWALEYRRWVVPLTMPFYALAFIELGIRTVRRDRTVAPSADESLRSPADGPEPDAWRLRMPIAYLLAATFAAVIGLQSVEWSIMTRHLMQDVTQSPALIVPRWELKWTNSSPMAHWATPCYVMVLQGKVPRKLLLESEADPRQLFETPPRVPLASFVSIPPQPGPGGWYDNRPLVAAIQRAYRHP